MLDDRGAAGRAQLPAGGGVRAGVPRVLSAGSGGGAGLGVLIGRAESPGWADGFQTQARLQTELHVAMGVDNATLWVLDRYRLGEGVEKHDLPFFSWTVGECY